MSDAIKALESLREHMEATGAKVLHPTRELMLVISSAAQLLVGTLAARSSGGDVVAAIGGVRAELRGIRKALERIAERADIED